MKFTDFDLSDSLLAGLSDIRFEEPTPVQQKAIPIVTQGKDLIATAQTGTGKTGAFVIPIMERVLQSERKGVKALIISPTRELATQIDEQIFAIGYHAGITSATVIGGSDFSQQAKALKAGVDIIVATPGRLIDQNKVVSIDFSNLEYFVLDEADRMLDMGFLPDIKKVISWLPEKRQTLLFSATMPNEIQKLANTIMKNPESVEIERSKPSGNVEQRAYTLRSKQKVVLVKKIFKSLEWDSCIIFTSTKKGTDELHRLLKREGIEAASIHGDRTQDERNKALDAFKNGKVPVIVATDVLSRGIDIKGVSIIINYDVPNNTDDYVHRIGRTGRYDKSGIAITFVTRRDSRKFGDIENIKGNKLKKIDLPDNFGERSEFSWDGPLKAKDSGKGKQDDRGDQQQKSSSNRGGGRSDDRQRSGKDQQKQQQKTESSGSDQKEKDQKSQKSGKDESKNRGRSSNRDNRSSGKENRGKKDSGSGDTRQENRGQGSRSKKQSGSGKESGESKPQKSQPAAAAQTVSKPAEKITLPPVVDKAIERNKRVRKPAKGFWGVIKSMIPKFKKS